MQAMLPSIVKGGRQANYKTQCSKCSTFAAKQVHWQHTWLRSSHWRRSPHQHAASTGAWREGLAAAMLQPVWVTWLKNLHANLLLTCHMPLDARASSTHPSKPCRACLMEKVQYNQIFRGALLLPSLPACNQSWQSDCDKIYAFLHM